MFERLIKKLPLIAILRGISPRETEAVGQALFSSGLRILEVPLNSPQAYTSIRILADTLGRDILVGAGTVTSPSEIRQVRQAGGRLIISPCTDVAVIEETKQQEMLSIPGCMTPTELFTATQAGADAIKLFPSEVLTPNAVRALRAVAPKGVPFFAVGGINEHNIPAYLQAGVTGFGIGSTLYRAGKSLPEIEADAKTIVSVVLNELRKL